MATIELIRKRVGNDIKMAVRLVDSEVAVDWTTVSKVKAVMVSDQQRIMMGECRIVGPDTQDATKLLMVYPAVQPQYLGVARLVLTVTYFGNVSTLDIPVLIFVASTAEEGTDTVEVEAPADLDPEDNNLELELEDIDTSVIQAAIDAANEAADRANAAAQHGPYINPDTHTWMVWDATSGQYVDTEVDAGGDGHSPYIGENGHWWEWDITTGDFVDSGVAAQGPAGRDGNDGTDGTNGTDGLDGHSPYIGDNGDWFVYDDSTQQFVDTQVKAQGPAGQNGTNGTNGTDGTDGHSPYIGNNGHWFVYDDSTQQYVDTDVNAQGPAGQNGTNGTNGTNGQDGAPGADGHSPYIGVNGNWYVWDTQSSQFVDSGVSAGADLTDYTDAELQTAIDTAFANL